MRPFSGDDNGREASIGLLMVRFAEVRLATALGRKR